MPETNYGDEWKKFIHSIPALNIAIENNKSITVGEFLEVGTCVETAYDQLDLSVRAINCLDREKLESRTVSGILSMPLQMKSKERERWLIFDSSLLMYLRIHNDSIPRIKNWRPL